MLDARKVRIDSKPMYADKLLAWIKDGTLVLQNIPASQDWDLEFRSRLIESMLLRIPLSTFYLDEDRKGILRVVDGLERLFAIRDYVDDEYSLVDLEYDIDALGKKFSELKLWQQRRIRETILDVQIFDPAMSHEVKLNIFERVRFPEYLSLQEALDRAIYLGFMKGVKISD
jgi:hypothetical protein